MSAKTVKPLNYFFIWAVIGWLGVATVCYLSLTPKPPQIDIAILQWDKLHHFMAYAVLMGWFMQLYYTVKARLFYLCGFIALGVGLEVLQSLGPVRQFEWADMLANTLGALSAVLVTRGPVQHLLYYFERYVLKRI